MCITLAKAVLPTLDRITINLTEFQEKISYGDQAIDEALLVLLEVQKVNSGLLNLLEIKKSALEILDLLFEGYAIFPGSELRRQLFDWWLLEVVPASYIMTTTKNLYTIKGLEPAL